MEDHIITIRNAIMEDLEGRLETAPGLWIILVNGKQLKTKSNKSSWKQIGHAKNALHHHLKTYQLEDKLGDDCDGRTFDKIYSVALQRLIDYGVIEFKQVRTK